MTSVDIQDIEISDDVLASGDSCIARFVKCIASGGSVRLAEMLALQQSPRVMTDDVMMGGIGNLDQQIKCPRQLDHICKEAMKHNYRPRVSDFYNAAIAKFPGDPAAFLNHGQGRGHIKKTLEQRGMAGEGLVSVKAREPESDPWDDRVRLDPKIVERIRKQKIKANPELARKDQGELRHDIVEAHGAK